MAKQAKATSNIAQKFNIVIVAQAGRLTYEAIIFLASLRVASPDFDGQVFVAEPQGGPKWQEVPSISDNDARTLIKDLGGTILPFETIEFGSLYPQGNKIECLKALPKGEPFVFFDTDTLITADIKTVAFDFDRPSASHRVEGTWPKPELHELGYAAIWKSLYDRFGLDFESSLDTSKPEHSWERYLYFNAGYFYYSCPHLFGTLFTRYACEILHRPPEELAGQSLHPWLDQVALPLVIHKLGGGRDSIATRGLDGSVSCHYRLFPLLYARESDAVVRYLETVVSPYKIRTVLERYDPIKRLVFQEEGYKIRRMFDREHLPKQEAMIRRAIKSAGLWMR